jgi:triosephosphate isomerase (TIM)
MKKIIIANWKCNPATLTEANKIFNSAEKNISKAEIVICPPFIYLQNLAKKKSKVKLGAQDCFWQNGGSYTGEISPLMLKNIGCRYVIIGHSERRKHNKENNQIIEKKVEVALKVGLKPILCIDKISQITKNIEKYSSAVIIAYEPLFAIGTGKSCSIEKAEKTRRLIQGKIGKKGMILYGGSVDSQNIEGYIKGAGFQGVLVGGSSLNSKEFKKMVEKIN